MSKLEQSYTGNSETRPDAENQEMISHAEAPNSLLYTKNQEPIPDNENPKEETEAGELDKSKEKTEHKYGISFFDFQSAGFWIQTLASIATVIMAILAWRTLIEMQTERNNAYRPEIVIGQNTFEGGQVSEREKETSGNCTCFDPYASAPDWILHPEFESIKDEAYYFESPYLTLKNIGQGTAKDIKVTFLINDWLKRAVDYLNRSDEGPFIFVEFQSNTSEPTQCRSVVDYRKSTEDVPITFISSYRINEKDYANINYIASGEDSVDVPLPKSWCQMLSVFFSLRMQLFASIEKNDYLTVYAELPDLIITIQYSDMQGKQYKQEESIPWNAYCKYLHTTESAGDANQPLHLWINIYDDYIR